MQKMPEEWTLDSYVCMDMDGRRMKKRIVYRATGYDTITFSAAENTAKFEVLGEMRGPLVRSAVMAG